MHFAALALLERGVAAGPHPPARWSATCAAALGHCGHCQLGPTLICRDGAGLPLRRARAADGGARAVSAKRASRSSPSGSSRRATAASSRCSTARTSCSRSRARSRSPTSSRPSSATVKGPYDLSLVEGSVTTAHDAERIQQVRRRRGSSSRSAPARPRAASRRSGTSPTSNDFVSVVYASPEYISTLDDLDADLGARPGRLRAQRLPDQQAPAARGDHRLPARPPAEHPDDERLHGVQAPRQRLRDGRARHAVPRPGHPCRLRRDLPVLQPRLLRLLRADGDAEHRLADAAAAGARHGRPRGRPRLPHVQRRRRSRRRARTMAERRTQDDQDRLPRPRRGRGRDARPDRGRPVERGRSSTSTSRRGSSRRSCAAARSPRRPTSPPASAASARSPTR